MNNVITKQELSTALRDQTEDIVGVIQSFVLQMDGRFDKIEKEIVELKESHNHLLSTIDGFVGRIDKYEIELVARDHQFEKLLAWARKVSEKTGIPLENL
jgi:hypothetical protein